MKATAYPWQRLWISDAAATIDYSLDYNGYFRPGSQAHPISQWQEVPCLILLGEPGMGKSWEWKQLKQHPPEQLHCFVNLGDFRSASQLFERLERKPPVRQWLAQPDTTLWLWLDSFDEGLLHEGKLAQALRDLLEEWPRERLRLRILSRTATWPDFFTRDLQTLFPDQTGGQGVHKLNLAPLTQDQVEEAAEAENVEPTQFFAGVNEADAVVMAMRPVTLRLLFGLWQAGEFGGDRRLSRSELFAAGCRHLCEEAWDEQRTRPPDYDPELRLRVAAHLALLMVFGNRRTILFQAPASLLTEHELLLRDVVGDTTLPSDKPAVLLSQPLVEQVLRHTGLFAPTPRQAFWAHQAYADFLAAWALHEAQVPVPQLRNLFRSTITEAGVVPALRDTAVWLASLSPEFAAALVEMDPLTAIRADGLTATDAQRAQMVDYFLHAAQERHIYPRRAERYLVRLQHPSLTIQLTPVLTSATASPEAKWLVYHLIESCRLHELTHILVQQVLTPGLAFNTRLYAIETLKSLADGKAKQALRAAIHDIPADDQDAQFRGTLLRLLWPQHLSVVELIPLLVRRQSRQLIGGAYHTFLDAAFTGEFQAGLVPNDLPHLLCWVLRRTGRSDKRLYDETERLICKAVLASAWRATDHPAVVRWLVPVVQRLLEQSHQPLYFPKEALARQRVVRAMADTNRLPDHWCLIRPYKLEKVYQAAAREEQALLGLTDWDFLLNLILECQSDSSAGLLYAAANSLLQQLLQNNDIRFQAYFGQLYHVVQTRLLPPPPPYASWVWDIDSTIAKNNQESLSWEKQGVLDKEASNKRWRTFNRRLLRRFIRLTRPERPTVFRDWYRVCLLLNKAGIDPLAAVHDAPLLRNHPRLQSRIVDLALRVVMSHGPTGEATHSLNSYNSEQLAYFHALNLCIQRHPDSVTALSPAEWQPWMRLMLFTGWYSRLLWRFVKQHQRKAVVRAAIEHIELRHGNSAEQHEWHNVNQLLNAIDDDLLRRLVLSRIMTCHWQLTFSRHILRQLLTSQFRSAELFRDALFKQPLSSQFMHRLTFDVIRWTLFDEESQVSQQWWRHWELLMRNHPDLLRLVVASATGTPSWEAPFPKFLDDDQLGLVLTWLVEKAGIREENSADDYLIRTPESRLRTARNTVAKRLAESATGKAWQILTTLSTALGYPRWLAYPLEEARETHSRLEWTPLPPADLLALCRNASQRWVQGREDLLDAIIESLDRLQRHMQGEPARANHLWYPTDKTGYRIRNGYKVVEENEVTDYVQAFLEDDLPRHIFSSHREVQLRAPSRPGTGQEVDLYVNAIGRTERGELVPTETVRVFVEAKHNDNPEVTTALNAQLVNRYLQNHPAKCGLFLVYWHTAETGRASSRGSVSELRTELARQAQAASKDGVVVRSYVLDIRLPDEAS